MGEEDLRRCHACSSDDCESLTFHCSICRFDLDTKCGLQLRSIDNNYDGQTILHCSHQHPLIPFHLTKALPAVEEESYVARQVREAGFILSDSEKIEDPEDSKHWEEEDADQESDATDSSLAALDNEIEALKAQLESLKLERARHILVSNKK
ncbi:hypothetical protein U1Q18_019303 [Sarracenia purpurea var. burkii]